MSQAVQESCPPEVWRWVAALAVLALVLMTVFTRYGGPQMQFETYQLRRLQALSTRPSAEQGDITVVALGNSLMRDGTVPQALLEKHLNEGLGHPRIRYVRIIRTGGNYPEFDRLWEAILKLKPALIVLQTEVLTAPSSPLERTIEETQKAMWWLLARKELPFAADDQMPGKERLTINAAGAKRRMEAMARDDSFRSPLSAEARLRLRQLQESGARVMVVDFPRSADYEAVLLASKHDWLKSLQTDTHQSGRLRVASYPSPLGPELFKDLAHLNAQGRAILSPWYVRQILACLGKEGTP